MRNRRRAAVPVVSPVKRLDPESPFALQRHKVGQTPHVDAVAVGIGPADEREMARTQELLTEERRKSKSRSPGRSSVSPRRYRRCRLPAHSRSWEKPSETTRQGRSSAGSPSWCRWSSCSPEHRSGRSRLAPRTIPHRNGSHLTATPFPFNIGNLFGPSCSLQQPRDVDQVGRNRGGESTGQSLFGIRAEHLFDRRRTGGFAEELQVRRFWESVHSGSTALRRRRLTRTPAVFARRRKARTAL
jgi:hypothetical protein